MRFKRMMGHGLWLLPTVFLAACSPTLNWRGVPLGNTTVMLPCKPDRGQRPVQLGQEQFVMEMVGCETDGALFAASRVEARPEQQQAALEHWYRTNLARLGDTTQSQGAMPPMKGRTLAVTSQGQGLDGKPLRARFLWQAGTNELILLAVYAPRVTSEMAEPLLIDLKLQ